MDLNLYVSNLQSRGLAGRSLGTPFQASWRIFTIAHSCFQVLIVVRCAPHSTNNSASAFSHDNATVAICTWNYALYSLLFALVRNASFVTVALSSGLSDYASVGVVVFAIRNNPGLPHIDSLAKHAAAFAAPSPD